MNLVQSLINSIKSRVPSKEKSPEGLCPNCWGRQQYGGQFYEAVKNHGIDANTIDDNIGWVQEYAEKHLAGIKLIDKDDERYCPNCKVSYKLK